VVFFVEFDVVSVEREGQEPDERRSLQHLFHIKSIVEQNPQNNENRDD